MVKFTMPEMVSIWIEWTTLHLFSQATLVATDTPDFTGHLRIRSLDDQQDS
jgi:hypothetical protein